MRAFRFGVVAGNVSSGPEWAELARKIESLGYESLLMPDGLKYTASPFPSLAVAATATERLTVATYVVDNDYRHPVMLAKEAATLALLSGDRLELGIGAGRPSAAPDNAMLGLPFDRGAVRLQRLDESLQIVKSLLSGETVDFTGQFYEVHQASIAPRPSAPPPILIAGSQRRLLTLAAQQADIIALGIGPSATDEEVEQRIGWIRDAAGERFDRIELNLNLMAVAGHVPRYLQMTLGNDATCLAESDAIPVLKGSVEQMCTRLRWLRERFGISYIAVGEELMDQLAPVVERLAGG